MVKDNLKLTGKLKITLFDTNGNVKDSREINNLVVTAGLNFITSRMNGTSAAVMSHMAVGTGTTAANAADTTLETELARGALTSAVVSTNTLTFVGDYAAGTGTGALTEAGIFNDATTGTMLARTVFAVVNKGASDTMQITWVITIG